MERVVGIGGHFIRAADPVAPGTWYRECLGIDADEHGQWQQEAGPTVFAAFESETDYFGSRAQQTMLNFRVRDLAAMLAQLRAKGADVSEETQGNPPDLNLAGADGFPRGRARRGPVAAGRVVNVARRLDRESLRCH